MMMKTESLLLGVLVACVQGQPPTEPQQPFVCGVDLCQRRGFFNCPDVPDKDKMCEDCRMYDDICHTLQEPIGCNLYCQDKLERIYEERFKNLTERKTELEEDMRNLTQISLDDRSNYNLTVRELHARVVEAEEERDKLARTYEDRFRDLTERKTELEEHIQNLTQSITICKTNMAIPEKEIETKRMWIQIVVTCVGTAIVVTLIFGCIGLLHRRCRGRGDVEDDIRHEKRHNVNPVQPDHGTCEMVAC